MRIHGKEIEVGMGIADMDFRAAPAITRALQNRMQHEVWGYMDMNGPAAAAYRQGIIDWNKRRYGVTINPANLLLTTGVHPSLVATLQTFCPRGSKVLMTTPVYNGFYGDLPYTGVTAEESPMRLVNGRYQIDFEDFERRATSDTKVFILCNPQNPTGNCWSSGRPAAARRDLPAQERHRARRRDSLRLRQQGREVHPVLDAAEQGDRQQQHHLTRRPASRSGWRR